MNLLNCLGVGTVAGTKDTNTNEIMVYLPSLFPTADGRVTTDVKEVERVSLNAEGAEVRSRQLHSNTIPATWKNMGDNNRLTSPDVREGSKVAIYQVAGQNRYYWTLNGVNAETMRLETVMWGWSASPEVSENAELDVDKFYMMKVSTHDGVMGLRTSQANNEVSAFEIQINAMEGNINIGGSNGSQVFVDDANQKFVYKNEPGSVIMVDKKKATFYLPEQLNLFTEETINIKTKELNIEAKTCNVDIGLTRWKGRIEHTGDSAQTGDHDQKGDYTQDGDTERTGNSTTSGTVIGTTDVTTALISLNTHVTTGVRGGNDLSGPPAPG